MRIMSSWKVKSSHPDMCLEEETETTSSQLSSELLVTGSITPSSTADRSTYSSDVSSMGLSHPASVTGTTETPSLAQSSGLTQALQRRAIAQPKDGIEISNWNSAPSGNLGLSMMVSGQCQNRFGPLFTDSRKIAQSLGMENHGRTHSTYEDYQKAASSAIGNLKIAEVDPGGHFVRILNCAPEKKESIGNYLLKQDVQGQPAAVFQFPPETRMGPNSTVTVWAADATVLYKPPSDFLWKDLERFRTSLDCATILCEPSGQAVAWYTPLYWNRRQGWVAKEESEKFENIVMPTFSTRKQKEGWENEQEFAITDTEWKRADSWQTRKKRQSFLKREKKTSASLFPNQSAWCQSPNSPTHPHFSLIRPLTMGNDGSSLCRQSRCQSARPDPVPGTLYAGASRKKNPSAPNYVSEEGRRRPTRSAGPNFGGVMYVGSLPLAGTPLQKYFVTPSYSTVLRMHRLLQLPAPLP
ncbi:lamin tail domain-containing protein 1 isoform X2 [Grus americana]|uniref:lamin tail domain-containing protein 1 isoform X2 n=1 Tax=Grus americana TaxID=9117 RepID=UPI002407E713|nr:lamin tail domain-containing protein 1 isoform X2 [Grus americana]